METGRTVHNRAHMWLWKCRGISQRTPKAWNAKTMRFLAVCSLMLEAVNIWTRLLSFPFHLLLSNHRAEPLLLRIRTATRRTSNMTKSWGSREKIKKTHTAILPACPVWAHCIHESQCSSTSSRSRGLHFWFVSEGTPCNLHISRWKICPDRSKPLKQTLLTLDLPLERGSQGFLTWTLGATVYKWVSCLVHKLQRVIHVPHPSPDRHFESTCVTVCCILFHTVLTQLCSV